MNLNKTQIEKLKDELTHAAIVKHDLMKCGMLESLCDMALESLKAPAVTTGERVKALERVKELAELIYRTDDNVDTAEECFYKIGPVTMGKLGDALHAVDVSKRGTC